MVFTFAATTHFFSICGALAGALTGFAKKSIELRDTIKILFKKKPDKLPALFNRLKQDREKLNELYDIIDFSKENSVRIYKKLVIQYVVCIATVFVAIVIIAYIMPDYCDWHNIIIPLVSIVASFLIINTVPLPVSFSFKQINEGISEIKDKTTQLFSKIFEENKSGIYKINNFFKGVNFLTSSEIRFLQTYLDLCSLKDSIEIFWLQSKMVEVRDDIYHSKELLPLVKKIIAQIIANYIDEGKSIKDSQIDIEREFAKAGLSDTAKIFNNEFFEKNFEDGYRKKSLNGIIEVIDKFTNAHFVSIN